MSGQTRRRQFLIAAGTLLAAARLSHAQQPQKLRRIGFLHTGPPPAPAQGQFLKAILDSLERAGYNEGVNLVIEWRYADGKPARLGDLAEELVRAKNGSYVHPGFHLPRGKPRSGPVVIAISRQ